VQWEISSISRIDTVSPLRDPITGRLADILKEVTGHSGLYGEMGSGDFGPIVALEWGAKLFGLGTIRADCGIHGKNEFVHQRDIEDLALVISRFVAT
jgi:acetylornithine deacetylase/succinyl-diaminopimelate desuccinylase-like protein